MGGCQHLLCFLNVVLSTVHVDEVQYVLVTRVVFVTLHYAVVTQHFHTQVRLGLVHEWGIKPIVLFVGVHSMSRRLLSPHSMFLKTLTTR